MPGAIYTGMSGMLAFSKALDAISHNVANLNTPGFKLSALQFQDLFYSHTLTSGQGQALELGSGVAAPSSRIRFSQGELRETSNGTDLAIEGNGFFVLRNGEGRVYTRAGQFEFGEDGFLVARGTQARVAALDADGALVDLEIGDLRVSRPKATATVKLIDNLSPGSSEHRVDAIPVFDSVGKQHLLSFVFTRDTATERTWKIEVREADGDTVAEAGEVRFAGDGSPLEGFEKTTFTFAPEDADGNEITLDFGKPGRFDGATSFSAGATSTLRLGSQDGFASGSALSFAFDEDGVLEVSYSNGETAKGPRVALAWLENLQALEPLGEGLFRAADRANVQLAAAGEGVVGKIRGGTIEISNVELTEQFTDLIIVQRGFQASSQVLTAANEMMQEIIENSRSRR